MMADELDNACLNIYIVFRIESSLLAPCRIGSKTIPLRKAGFGLQLEAVSWPKDGRL
jgi:hypothetical protein